MIKVEFFSTPGCGKCVASTEALKAVVEALGEERVQWSEINILDAIEYAVALGIMSPPAIAIDGVLVFPALPSADTLRAAIQERLEQ